MAISCFALLVLILALLGYWQRRISENEDQRVLSDIREARETGTNKALAQHPQIDVQACIGCGSCIAACPEEDVIGLVDGVAHIVHGSRCIGHARCAVACPVGAIQVGLGELAKSPNLPILSPGFETSLPGVHVAGELGGFALIRIAVEQGTRAVETIARDLAGQGQRAGKDVLDLLIVGAGPAGLAASLKARELGLRYLTIDQDDVGGTVRKYPRRKLTLTGPLEMPLYGRVEREEFLKEELIEFWQGLIDHYQLRIETGIRLEGLDQGPEAYSVRTSARPLQARRVILALGRRGTPRQLGVPGEEAEKVLYHLVDAATYKGMRLLVVGGGDSAIEAATALGSQPGNTVTLSYRREAFFRIKARNAERIQQFQGDGKVRVVFGSQVGRIEADAVSLKVNDGGVERTELVPNDFVLVCAGGDPPYALLRGMGVRFNGDVEPAPAPTHAVAGKEGLS
jgi:thioredoxin reductase/Pyruvate/2-oxoacid:ferredoxin oxidoreductase delta subunit